MPNTTVQVAAQQARQPVLSTRGLTKNYTSKGSVPVPALTDFDLDVAAGEFLGVMGPSGSGKSTLLNLLATIDEPTAGSLRVAGTDPAGMNAEELAHFRRRKLGFVFQEYNLLDSLTARENILLPLVLDRVGVKEMNARLGRVAERFGIAELLKRRPYELSGGQQQRVAIARAVITEPELVLADEPTGSLDSRSSQNVMESLASLQRAGATIVMVTHDPFAASHASRIVFIKDGRHFGELRRGTNRQAFFQQVLDTLSMMGGAVDDVPAASVK